VDAQQAVNAPRAVSAPRAQSKPGHTALVPIVAGLGILSAALAALYVGLRRRVPTSKGSRGEGAAAPADGAVETAAKSVGADAVATDGMPDVLVAGTPGQGREPLQGHVQDGMQTAASNDARADAGAGAAADSNDATHPMLPVISAAPAGRSEIATGAGSHAMPQEPTVNLQVEPVNLRMDPTRLDYNFLDLDMTAQHVQMPSVLNEHAVVKERRTNLADVLKLAIEREPDRHDLRMKLLELYYSAAATNRKAFLEVVQKFARDRDYLQTEQWEKISFMGRQIASDNPMFTEGLAADDDLADCA
jgi:hypothetical protein